jgi:hypothetical protein
VARLLIIVGGALMALSVAFQYLTLRLDLTSQGGGIQHATLNGLDVDVGPYLLGGGVMLIVLGLLMLILSSRTRRVVLGIAAITVSGFMLYLGVANIAGLKEDTLKGLAEQAAPGTDKTVILENLRAVADFSAGWGLYVAVGGASLAFLGGLLALRPEGERKGAAATPVPAAERWRQSEPEARVSETSTEDPHVAWRPPGVARPPSGPGSSDAPADPWRRRPPPEGPSGT